MIFKCLNEGCPKTAHYIPPNIPIIEVNQSCKGKCQHCNQLLTPIVGAAK